MGFECVSQFKASIRGIGPTFKIIDETFLVCLDSTLKHQLRRKRICAHRSCLPHPTKVLRNDSVRRACPVWDMAAITRSCENINMISKTLQVSQYHTHDIGGGGPGAGAGAGTFVEGARGGVAGPPGGPTC